MDNEKYTCKPYCDSCGNNNPGFCDDGPPWCAECDQEMVYPRSDLYSQMDDKDQENVCKNCLIESLKNAEETYDRDEKEILTLRAENDRLRQ